MCSPKEKRYTMRKIWSLPKGYGSYSILEESDFNAIWVLNVQFVLSTRKSLYNAENWHRSFNALLTWVLSVQYVLPQKKTDVKCWEFVILDRIWWTLRSYSILEESDFNALWVLNVQFVLSTRKSLYNAEDLWIWTGFGGHFVVSDILYVQEVLTHFM